MKKLLSFSVRARTLMSLLCVALIPICTILVVFYNYNVGELLSDIEKINMNRMQQIKNSLEIELREHNRLRQALCDDSFFLKLVKRGQRGDVYDALNIFRNYINYRDTVGEAAILIEGQDRAFHVTGVSSDDVYFDGILNVDNEQKLHILLAIEDINTDTPASVIPILKRNGEQGLLCLYPMPAYMDTDITLIIDLSLINVMALFQPLIDNLEGFTFLMNNSGEIIFKTGDTEELAEMLSRLPFEDESQKVAHTAVGRQQYTVIYSSSRNAGLTYGMVVAEDRYQTQVIKQTTLIWQMVLFALVLCVGVILFLTAINYKPIKALMELTGTKLKRGVNEFDEIHSVLIDTRSRAETLEKRLDAQKPYMLERLLGYVLGTQMTPEQSSQFFDSMDLKFDYGYFFVMCMRMMPSDASGVTYSSFKAAAIEATELIEASASAGNLREFISESFHCYTMEHVEDKRLAIVVNCVEGFDTRRFISLFREYILNIIGTEHQFITGIGSISTGFSDLKMSLYEANVLVENLTHKPVLFAEDIESLPNYMQSLIPVKDFILFLEQFRQGDEKTTIFSFKSICDNINRDIKSTLISKHVYMSIALAMDDIIRRNCGCQFDAKSEKLTLAKDAEAFYQAGKELIEVFCRYVKESKNSTRSRLKENILQYIKDNSFNPELSLNSIAEHFSLSPYYVSRFFRDQNNMNLKDYVTYLRIERAKSLLANTNRPVGDIVNDIGYQSVSNFIRKFKASVGMTPGQYRDTYSNK